jgi:hypothetical protein
MMPHTSAATLNTPAMHSPMAMNLSWPQSLTQLGLEFIGRERRFFLHGPLILLVDFRHLVHQENFTIAGSGEQRRTSFFFKIILGLPLRGR